MKIQHILYNNQFFPSSTALLKVNNRAGKYGDGLFESIRIINGEILNLQNHVNRINRGIEVLNLNDSGFFISPQFAKRLQQLLEMNGVRKGGRLRLQVYRNGSGLYRPKTNQIAWFAETQILKTNSFAINYLNYVAISNNIHTPGGRLAGIKSINALPFILASLEMEKQNLDELILLDHHLNISETSSANVFWVRNGEWFTPSLKSNCVSGIMRNRFLHFLKSEKLKVQQGLYKSAVLKKADMVVLTNAIKGISIIKNISNLYSMRDDVNLSYLDKFIDKLNQRI